MREFIVILQKKKKKQKQKTEENLKVGNNDSGELDHDSKKIGYFERELLFVFASQNHQIFMPK